MTYLLRGLLVLWCVCVYSHLYADELSTGLKALHAKNYKEAESSFSRAQSLSTTPRDRAQLLKLLGISQFMQGERSKASENFKIAKSLDPQITLTSEEILEVSLVDFFNSIQGEARSLPSKKRVTPAAPSPQIPTPPPVVAPPPAAAPRSEQEAQLQVLSNVLEAKVVIDDIPRGKIGDMVTVSVGSHDIEVHASGYSVGKESLVAPAGELIKVKIPLEPLPRKEDTMSRPETTAPNEPSKTKLSNKTKKKIKTKIAKPKEETPSWEKWMPLGVPQFSENQFGLGITFATTQVATLGGGIYLSLSANKDVESLDSYTADREAQSAQITDPADQSKFDDETQAEFDTRNQAIERKRKIALGLYITSAALWVTSVFLSGDTPPPATASTASSSWRLISDISHAGDFSLGMRLTF